MQAEKPIHHEASRMKTNFPALTAYRITMSDPRYNYVTSVAAWVKTEDAREYFLGRQLQFGDTHEHPGDLLLTVLAVDPL